MRVACVLRFADSIRETRNVAREPEELTLLGSGISVAGESDTAPLGERSGTGMDRTTAGARMDQGAKSYAAEFIGTFTLCFIGQGAICTLNLLGGSGADLLPIAAAHGLALCVMVSALGAVSGGHFNPAVTFGFLVTGRQKLPSAIAYALSQLLGAVAASALLAGMFPETVRAATHLGAAVRDAAISAPWAVVIEAVLTFFLATAVWGTAVDARGPKIGGFAIGLAVM